MEKKDRFVELLLVTERPGADRVLNGLAELGFFEAPASTRFQEACPEGCLTIR